MNKRSDEWREKVQRWRLIGEAVDHERSVNGSSSRDHICEPKYSKQSGKIWCVVKGHAHAMWPGDFPEKATLEQVSLMEWVRARFSCAVKYIRLREEIRERRIDEP